MMNKRKASRWMRSVLLCAALTACTAVAETPVQKSGADRVSEGKALFDERCRTVAGEKIYRTVDDVEGIVLLKVRPARGDRELSDPNWPGAAFSREFRADEFIKTFLGYEHSSSQKAEPVTPERRGFVGVDYQPSNPSNLPGYRYVDVVDEKTGERWRYSGYFDRPWEREPDRYSSKNPYSFWKLDRKPTLGDSPRYGVTYEDHVIPDERALGLASSTVKVLDLKTNEVLGEFTRYAWTAGVLESMPRSPSNPTPWLTAYTCGNHLPFAGAETRQFVDQILKPRVGK